MARRTMGEFQNEVYNKVFNESNYVLNDPKSEIYIGQSVNNGKLVFDRFKKSNFKVARG